MTVKFYAAKVVGNGEVWKCFGAFTGVQFWPPAARKVVPEDVVWITGGTGLSAVVPGRERVLPAEGGIFALKRSASPSAVGLRLRHGELLAAIPGAGVERLDMHTISLFH